MELQPLREIGLTGTEIKVYLALLRENEAMLVSEIARKSKINRSLTYTILSNLYSKGLVNYVIRENRKYYFHTKPEKIIDILEERKNSLNMQIGSIKDILPSLKELSKTKTERPKLVVYEGLEGLKAALENVLREKKDYMILGWTGILQKQAKYWYAHFTRRRVKFHIRRRFLCPYHARGEAFTKTPLTDAKFLPRGYSVITSVVIYGNKCFITLPSEEEIMGLMIESKKITDSYRHQFELLWKIAKP